MGNLVALLGMVPEPPGVRDRFAVVVDERIVDRDDPVFAIPGGRALLQEVEAAVVQPLHVPVGVGEEAVEARGIGGLGEFPVDGGDVLALGYEEAGEILG